MSDFVNDQQREAYINSLLRERDHYEAKGDKAGVKDVTEELQRLGAEAKPKAKRVEKRPAEPKGKETR